MSFTAISDDDWWVLSANACHRPRCAAIAHTTNDGRLRRVEVPSSVLDHGHALGELRFADARDGYLVGKRLYATHDGGRSWTMQAIGRNVGLATADGFAYAVAGGVHHNALWRSPVSGGDWTRLPTPQGFVLSELWVQGSDVFLYGRNDSLTGISGGGRLLESTDSGRSWVVEHLPIEDLICSTDVVALPAIWEQCATGMMSGIWRSTDSGRSFAQPSREGSPGEPNAAAFAAASDDVVVVGFQDLRRTTDGGRHWREVPGTTLPNQGSWEYLGFTDARHGAAITLTNVGSGPTRFGLWLTGDAGAHWHRARGL